MYGLPKDFDGAFLLERTLVQICLSANTMTFHFDDDISITLESEYTCADANESSNLAATRVPVFQPELAGLLEQTVRNVNAFGDGTLSLTFANGYRLALHDSAGYEAYHIQHGPTIIIV